MQTGQNCINTFISSSFKPKSCSFQACSRLLQAQLYLMGYDDNVSKPLQAMLLYFCASQFLIAHQTLDVTEKNVKDLVDSGDVFDQCPYCSFLNRQLEPRYLIGWYWCFATRNTLIFKPRLGSLQKAWGDLFFNQIACAGGFVSLNNIPIAFFCYCMKILQLEPWLTF